MNISEALIDEVIRINNAPLAGSERKKVQNCLLDYLAVSFAGEKMLRNKIGNYSSDFNPGKIKLIGSKSRSDLLTSSFLHGMISHVAELDDGHRYGMFHPGVPIFSSILPIMQVRSFDLDRFYKAVLCGYQISIKIARLMQPDLKERGFHATGVAGTIGAGMAAGILLSFDKRKLLSTLSACCTSASGILKVIKDGSDMKPLNVAYAAQNGISAAMSARAGFSGADDVLGSKLGFIETFIDKSKSTSEVITDEEFQIHTIYLKPYAACRHCHGPIQGTINLFNRTNIDPEKIEKIDVETYQWAIDGHDHQQIRGVNSAKMSIPFSVATAGIHGRADIELFEEPYISDKSIMSLSRKVFVHEDRDYTRMVPGKRAARVTIRMNNGETVSEEILMPKGEPESPVTETELAEKFISLLVYGGQRKDKAAQLLYTIQNLGDKKTDSLIEFIYKL